MSKAGGSWSGAPTHYLKDAQDGLGALLKIGISKGEEPKVKAQYAREQRLIDRLSLPQLTEFGRVARNFWTGIQGPPKTRQTKRAWLQQVIEYAGNRTSMLLTAPIGVTQSVEDSIEKAAGRLPDQLTLRGIDPDSREGLGAQIDLNATSITRLEARRRKLQADLRAARRLRRPKGEIKQITDAITEVDDRLLGLRASNTRLARQQSTAQSNAEIQAGATAGGQDPDLQAQLDQAKCIGCGRCYKVCPTDAILGAAKHIHAVFKEACTACGSSAISGVRNSPGAMVQTRMPCCARSSACGGPRWPATSWSGRA